MPFVLVACVSVACILVSQITTSSMGLFFQTCCPVQEFLFSERGYPDEAGASLKFRFGMHECKLKQEKQCAGQLHVGSPQGVEFGGHDPFSFCWSI